MTQRTLLLTFTGLGASSFIALSVWPHVLAALLFLLSLWATLGVLMMGAPRRTKRQDGRP